MRPLAIALLGILACSKPTPAPTPTPTPAPVAEPMAPSEEDPPADLDAANRSAAREQAKDRYVAGRKAYDLGDFATAATEFEAAHALFPDASFLFNIGQAYR